MAPPSLSWWYRRRQFADASVFIVQRSNDGDQADAPIILDVVPAHRLVLYERSKFFQAKLDNWESSSDSSIQLEVPPGQLRAGQLLLQCMYDDPHLKLQLLPQMLLLEVLLLADKYDAQAIAAAAAAELGRKSAEQLEWQVVVRLFELQHYTEHTLVLLPGYVAAIAAGAAKLRAALGDLEVAWQSQDLAQVLQHLPFSLLLRLLSDPETRVASEDTIVFTIAQRHAAQQQPAMHQQHAAGLTEEQLAQLVQHVRVPRCSPLFLATVMPSTPWLLRHVPPHHLPLATSLAVLPSMGPARQAITGYSAVLAAQPAWQLPTRPASAVRRLEVDLRVPITQVRHLVEQGLKTAAAQASSQPAGGRAAAASEGDSGGSVQHCGSSSGVSVWCGKRFQLQMGFGSSRKLEVALLMLPSLQNAPLAAAESCGTPAGEQQQPAEKHQHVPQLAAVQCSLCAVRFGVQEVCRRADKPRSLVAGQPRRWTDFFGLGEVCSWEQVRAGLARQHLGVGAAELHVRATLTKVW